MSSELAHLPRRAGLGRAKGNSRGATLVFGAGRHPRITPPCSCGYPLIPRDEACPRCGAPTRPAA